MKPTLIALAVAALALSTAACDAQPQADHGHVDAVPNAATASAAQAATTAAEPAPVAPQLQADLRMLWQGHVQHTRDYALAIEADDTGAADVAATAVVDNAKALAGAVAGFYGEAAGDGMLQLLAGHWGGVKAMTDARKAGDRAGVDQAMADLIANAGEIAVFLSGANPYLPEDAVRGLLVAHGGHHAAQIEQIMSGDMAGEAQTWKAMQAHMDVIADALAGAIARQFPDKAA